ncbi:MAG TPA: hypothetical protein VKB93_28165 [Thermoanaerobaculia bacterium]|nr:hypothetical protein [Thermoanaerobaculia bacterium]
MLWYKSWLETRWRFLIGLFILTCSAASAVLTFPKVRELMEYVPTNLGGIIGDRIREAVDLASTYRGFVWSNWFRQNLAQTGTLFAVLLGIASVFSPSRGALFTLSLPVSRQRLLGVRAATGLVELSVLAFLPSLLIPLLTPAIHQTYGVSDTLIHALCFFTGASLFFALALLLSTIFSDPWRPLLITIGIAIFIGILEQLFRAPSIGVFRVMSGELWFRDGRLPWAGLLALAVASASIYYGAVRNLVRRDF